MLLCKDFGSKELRTNIALMPLMCNTKLRKLLIYLWPYFFVKLSRRRGQSPIAWPFTTGLNTKFVLGLPRANQMGQEHEQIKSREV